MHLQASSQGRLDTMGINADFERLGSFGFVWVRLGYIDSSCARRQLGFVERRLGFAWRWGMGDGG